MKQRKRYSTSLIIILGFALLILIGTFLLTLPISSQSGQWTNPLTALFTAVSASCVTGLVVVNTAAYWSVFGKVILLILIQIGGLGVVLTAIAFALLAGTKISLAQRMVLQDSLASDRVGGIVRFSLFILRSVFLMETLGAVCLMPTFIPIYGVKAGVAYSFFHSISAFCNAGFDLTGDSLAMFHDNIPVNLIIMALIISGGLGFRVWRDLRDNHFHISKCSLQTKIVLSTSAFLILVPFLGFFFLEYADLPLKDRILVSLFQSVTARTAGFNTADLAAMHDTGKLTMIFLMLIGGSPGSTAGGMKTTTIAVLLYSSLAVFRHHGDTTAFGKRIPSNIIRSAAAIFTLYLTMFLISGVVISRVEDLPLLSCLFETASAVGTVGVTLGLTSLLSSVSKVILILLMFFGRMGGLTIMFATFEKAKPQVYRLPEEEVSVG